MKLPSAAKLPCQAKLSGREKLSSGAKGHLSSIVCVCARRTCVNLISDFYSKQALCSLFLSEQENAECVRETRRVDLKGGAKERPLLQCVAAGNINCSIPACGSMF